MDVHNNQTSTEDVIEASQSGPKAHLQENQNLLKAKASIGETFKEYHTQQITKLLQKIKEHTNMKDIISQLAFVEWKLKEKDFNTCNCCHCHSQCCLAMDRGDDMVYFYLKDCPHAYNKSQGRLAWEWLCYSVALPCLCFVVLPILGFAGGCYCRGCLPNVFICRSLEQEVALQKQRRRINDQLIAKLKKLKTECQSYA